ncbi:hypothetical protein IWX46DRAFT_205677 [Phyllosticta citricarpa]|uniref:Uncharacterized protein n=1 Tax=Phyllosticta citricarpa TaxID=55181 RepID=A0ABR1LVJ1_9PEZI
MLLALSKSADAETGVENHQEFASLMSRRWTFPENFANHQSTYHGSSTLEFPWRVVRKWSKSFPRQQVQLSTSHMRLVKQLKDCQTYTKYPIPVVFRADLLRILCTTELSLLVSPKLERLSSRCSECGNFGHGSFWPSKHVRLGSANTSFCRAASLNNCLSHEWTVEARSQGPALCCIFAEPRPHEDEVSLKDSNDEGGLV